MSDREINSLIKAELKRQQEGLELIPSENIASREVLEALGSVFTNKYSEGYPGARYYGGNEYADDVENLCRERAKKLFGVPHVNVQPYSGSPANFAVYIAVCNPGDTIMGQNLLDGGHLTHGWKVSITSQFYNSVPYHVKTDGYIDLDEVRELALKNKPKLIWCGATAYPREFPFKEFGEIADEVGAYFAADIAHVSGLVVSGAHPSPVEHAHIVTTTTHKTLRGPRGGMIMITNKGLEKDPDLAIKIDKAVFPGLQGGPHDNQTAAIAVALHEASLPGFKEYGKKVVENSKALAKFLSDRKIKLVTGGTDNHMILVGCGVGKGAIVEKALDVIGITANKNTIPGEKSSPFYPSGLRIGTPSITTRGMGEKEMEKIADLIDRVIKLTEGETLPESVSERKEYLRNLASRFSKGPNFKEMRRTVKELCLKFPAYDN